MVSHCAKSPLFDMFFRAVLFLLYHGFLFISSQFSSFGLENTHNIWYYITKGGGLVSMLLSEIRTGEDFEQYIFDILRSSRICVEKTVRSHDYGADLIVRFYGVAYAVQCKYSINPIGVSAVQEAVASLPICGADCAAVVTNSTFTSPAKRLAIMNGCLLFDGPGSVPYVSEDSEMGLDFTLLEKLMARV